MAEAAQTSSRKPEFFETLKSYSPKLFGADLVAGVTVGLVALPLAMAFAISSGVAPEAGIYCAIVAGFLSSLLGGSRTQISGPTGAFVIVVAGIVSQFGLQGLFLCTIMAGIILLAMGLTGLGSAVKFIPRPVVVGFTNGIAVLIASTQIKDFFGLRMEEVPSEFIQKMGVLASAFPTLNPAATILSLVCLAVMLGMRKFTPKVPGAVVVLFIGTLIAVLVGLPVETIHSRFGGIPQGLPSFQVPTATLSQVQLLLAPAITVAMLGAIESLMSAVVADKMTDTRHRPNVELVGQGVANIVSPLFGGLPSTGAIARTATNIRAGAKTPVSGMIHALTLLAILLVAAPLANHIPLAILASILLVVAYNMGEWKEIPSILKLTPADISVWAVTFALTVLADLTVAVQAGMILAALLYISKVSRTTTVMEITGDYVESGREHALQLHEIPNGVAVYRIGGPFLFGSTDKVETILQRRDLPPVVILRLRNMTAIDATGIQALEELATRLQQRGHTILFCGMPEQPAKLMRQSGFAAHVGEENIRASARDAFQRAREILSKGREDGEVETSPPHR